MGRRDCKSRRTGCINPCDHRMARIFAGWDAEVVHCIVETFYLYIFKKNILINKKSACYFGYFKKVYI